MMALCIILICVMLLPAPVQAAYWTGILDSARAMDWSSAGATITHRTTICSSLTSSATAADINTAIAGCGSGEVVYLAAGTYSLSTGLLFANKSNVTLRGAGPNLTKLVFTGYESCNGLGGVVCIRSGDTSHYSQNPSNTANWTAGYSKGTTVVTLSSVTNLAVGSLLALDQLNDSADTGDIFICDTTGTCSSGGPALGMGRTGRPLHQLVRVTAINGNDVTISPGIVMPNFRSGQTPGAWWANSFISGVGIEDLQIDSDNADTGGNTQVNAVIFVNAYNSWMRNVHSRFAGRRSHAWIYGSKNITVRDSYFYEGQDHASQSYGIETMTGSDCLIENNIFQKVTAPVIFNGTGHGCVVAYNYMRDNPYGTEPTTWMIPTNDHHATGVGYVLHEGNVGTGLIFDNVHGPGAMITAFRNYWTGTQTAKTQQTIPIHIYHYSRYFNFVGNVLGTNGFHTTYECVPATTTTAGCVPGKSVSIFTLGWSSNEGEYYAPYGLNDTKVASTSMRWGNYDTVNAAVRWQSSEVPSGISPYPNSVPADQVLPASFYLSAKPSWWGSTAWPSIGPDVTGGEVSNVGGHVNRNPAQICYDNTAKVNGELVFNWSACTGLGAGAGLKGSKGLGLF